MYPRRHACCSPIIAHREGRHLAFQYSQAIGRSRNGGHWSHWIGCHGTGMGLNRLGGLLRFMMVYSDH